MLRPCEIKDINFSFPKSILAKENNRLCASCGKVSPQYLVVENYNGQFTSYFSKNSCNPRPGYDLNATTVCSEECFEYWKLKEC